LNSCKDLHWYCGRCETKVLKSIHLDKEINQKLDLFWAKVEDRLAQCDREVESIRQHTNAQIQSVETGLKDLRADMNRNLQQINEDMNNARAAFDKQLTLNQMDVTNLSTKVTEIFEGQEGEWTEVVKRQVNKSLETASGNIEEVQHNLCETRAEAEKQRQGKRKE